MMNRASTSSDSVEAKNLFMQCRQVEDEQSREELLASVEPSIAEEVRTLLRSIQRGQVIDNVFEIAERPDLAATADDLRQNPTDFLQHTHEIPGTRIGNYKLLEMIGEGGMGTVFMAQQTQPVKRKVAIKIVKPGMDSRQVVARFEAERQALAMMDHPNIARVFDGGTTDFGRPYFVMELVNGIPLTDFCEHKKLPLEERLQLCIDVCRGVQHAHQRGIIHRDLKPGNVLVTLHDDRPVVKIIDFGIAKAMNAELTDKTLFTQFASMVGTPLYMSPEQAELSGLDVDVRSDVYSLGVMLYELLTGTTPFDRETLKSKGLDEVRRMIRETEPPRPSQRVSRLRAAGEEAIKLEKFREKSELTSELDWIVMRAIEKDRQRRYQSASEFADDIGRYMAGEVVQACPPSITYRARKLVSRHRYIISAAAIILLTALTGTAFSLVYASNARRASTEAISERKRAERETDRAEAEEQRAEENFDLSVQAIEQLMERVADQKLRESPETGLVVRSIFEDIVAFYDRLVEKSDRKDLRFRRASVLRRLADLNHDLEPGNREKFGELYAQAISELESLLKAEPLNQAVAAELTHALMLWGHQTNYRADLLKQAISVAEAHGLPQSRRIDWRSHYAASLKGLAIPLPPEDALVLLQTARRVMTPDWGEDGVNTSEIDIEIGRRLISLGRIKVGVNSVVTGADLSIQRSRDLPTRENRFLAMFDLGKAIETLAPHDLGQAHVLLDEFAVSSAQLLRDFPQTENFRVQFLWACQRIFNAVEASRGYEDAVEYLNRLQRQFPSDYLGNFQLREAYRRKDHARINELVGALCGLFKQKVSLVLMPRDHLYCGALVTATAGDLANYRRLVASYPISPSSEDSLADIHWIIRAVSLAPNATDDYEPYLTLVSNYLSSHDVPDSLALLDVAFLEYRAGEIERAKARLASVDLMTLENDSPACGMYLQAMIAHSLEHHEESQQWLERANHQVEDELVDGNARWSLRSTLELLRREVEKLITATP